MPRNEIFLNFANATAAKVVATKLGLDVTDPTQLPKDGWFTARDGNSYYYCIDVCFGTGTWMMDTGQTTTDGQGRTIPVKAPQPFYINVLWMGPIDQWPDFGLNRVFPLAPAVRFG